MATGHILPGYGNPVTRLRRAQTDYPLDQQKLNKFPARNIPDLDRRTLDSIRQNARNMWQRPNYDPTTYNTFHTGYQLDEPTESQPTDPQRRHKPHPKPVFLTNRLHYVPGYHNPDATMGKEVYRVDDTFSEEERQLRRHQREKFIARPRTAAVDQYKEPWAQLTDAVGPVEAWGAQAWLKTADDDHQHEVVNAIRDYKDKELFNTSKMASQAPAQNLNTKDHAVVEKLVIENESGLQLPEENSTNIVKTKRGKRQEKIESCVIKQENGGKKKLKDIAVKLSLTKGNTKQENDSGNETLKQKNPPKKFKTCAKSQKKGFPLKVTTSAKDVSSKTEVDIIVNRINNKFSLQGNRTKESFMKQQQVKYRSPVQSGGKKYRIFKQEERGQVEKEKKDAEDADKDALDKNTDIRVMIQRQYPVPPYVADASPRPHTAIPSMHRWMKKSGARESEQMRSIMYGGYPPSTIQTLGNVGYPNTTLARRQEEVDNIRKVKFLNRYPRGDFLIHPEYPPSLPHHRID